MSTIRDQDAPHAAEGRAGGQGRSARGTTGGPGPEGGSDNAAATRRTTIRPRTGWQAINLKELWIARDLLRTFTLRDITVRYKQTFFGFAWAIIVPLVQVVIFSIFFGKFLGVGDRVDEAAGGREIPYPLFALTGQVVWNFFSGGVNSVSGSLQTNAMIIRKIYVPRLVLPLASMGKPIVDNAIVLCLMVVMTIYYAYFTDAYDVVMTWKIVFSPLLLLAAAVPTLGVGLILSAVTVHYRDLRYILPFIIQTLFYITPVIYPVDILPANIKWVLFLNPIAGYVNAHRACVMDMPMDWLGLGISVALSTVLLLFGLFYFARVERHFADVA